jgi:hypothetical protein
MIVQIEYRFSEGNLGLRSNVPLKAVWWAELERKGDDNLSTASGEQPRSTIGQQQHISRDGIIIDR